MSARKGTRIPYPSTLDELSDLDVQIIDLLRRGLTYTEIGRETGVNERTIGSRVAVLSRLHHQHGIHLPDSRQAGRTPIARTIDDLGPMDQQLLELFQQDTEYAEIGRILDMPRQTVATRICRLRDNLGEELVPRRHRVAAGEHSNTAKQPMPGDRAGLVRCLGGCGDHFNSPDRCRIRICPECKSKRRLTTEGLTEHHLFTA